MPFVAEHDAANQAFTDVESLADRLGPPPWRAAIVGTPRLRVVLLHWEPGFATVPHRHPYAEEVFEVVRGRALFRVGDEPEREVTSGSFVVAMKGVRHAIRVPAGEPLLMLASVSPNEDRADETIEPG